MVPHKKVAASACLLVCFFSATFAQPQKSIADKIVAVAGDHIILRSDIEYRLANLRREGTPIPDGAQCTIVKDILESKIFLLQAVKDSVTVTDEEVEAEVNRQISASNNTIPPGKRKEFFTWIKEYMMANLMQETLLSKVKMTPMEVKSFYESFPSGQLPFFEARYEIGQIAVYPKPTAEMEKYLLDEMNHYKQRVERKQISFQQLAISVSEDNAVKENQGVYRLNRNVKTVDPLLLSAAFRLKDGEISSPIKIKGGYCLIRMMEREGDEATAGVIFRATPVAEKEIKEVIFNLNTVRAEIKLGEANFEQAAKKHSEIKQAAFSAFIQNRNGEPFVTLDELDKDLAKEIINLKTGEITEAKTFIDEEGKKGIRIVFLKSKTEPHRMNLTDDYSRVAQLALDKKRQTTLASWFKANISDFDIVIEEEIITECPQLREYSSK